MPTSSVFKVVRLRVYIYAIIFLTGKVPIFLISGNIFSIAPPPPPCQAVPVLHPKILNELRNAYNSFISTKIAWQQLNRFKRSVWKHKQILYELEESFATIQENVLVSEFIKQQNEYS